VEYKIDYYKKSNYKIPFNDWLEDQDVHVRAMINVRIDRLSFGNFTNCEPVRENISEVKIHKGPGYRIYYNMIGLKVVLILNAGIKKTQPKDIGKAIEYLADYIARGKKYGKK
jgi:putative addiction module killer protein